MILGKDGSEEFVGEGAAFRVELLREEVPVSIESIFDERESLLDDFSVVAEESCERFREGEVGENTASTGG